MTAAKPKAEDKTVDPPKDDTEGKVAAAEKAAKNAAPATTIEDDFNALLVRIEEELEEEPDKWALQAALGAVAEQAKKLDSE